LGLAVEESVSARIAPGEAYMSLLAWPGGADHCVAFIGGPNAWKLAHQGQAATIAFVRDTLRAWFGAEADACFGEALVTDWAENPWHGGSYAYARPGHAGDRALLGAPLADGRLVIAGEATAGNGLAGTVAGAWNEGQRAARAVRLSS
jgi:monoamine oxidase